jgi:hypothetical protein
MPGFTAATRLRRSLTLATLCTALVACDAGDASAPPMPSGTLPALDRSRDLRGPDVNDNGVRDDIEADIDALSLTDPQRKAAMQTARVQQRSMPIDLTDRPTVVALGDASMTATKCMAVVFEGSAADRGGDLSLKIEATAAHTPQRAATSSTCGRCRGRRPPIRMATPARNDGPGSRRLRSAPVPPAPSPPAARAAAAAAP